MQRHRQRTPIAALILGMVVVTSTGVVWAGGSSRGGQAPHRQQKQLKDRLKGSTSAAGRYSPVVQRAVARMEKAAKNQMIRPSSVTTSESVHLRDFSLGPDKRAGLAVREQSKTLGHSTLSAAAGGGNVLRSSLTHRTTNAASDETTSLSNRQTTVTLGRNQATLTRQISTSHLREGGERIVRTRNEVHRERGLMGIKITQTRTSDSRRSLAPPGPVPAVPLMSDKKTLSQSSGSRTTVSLGRWSFVRAHGTLAKGKRAPAKRDSSRRKE
jgi:hypothetical protein